MPWPRLFPLLVAIALGGCSVPKIHHQANHPTGLVVVDGDTLHADGIKIRLHGIDAPELHQPCLRPDGTIWWCGRTAKTAMSRLVSGRHLTCENLGHDRYDRTLARCEANGVDIEAEMVRKGLALAYRRYSMDYADMEDEAKAAGRGIWATKFDPPWIWRKSQSSGSQAHQ